MASENNDKILYRSSQGERLRQAGKGKIKKKLDPSKGERTGRITSGNTDPTLLSTRARGCRTHPLFSQENADNNLDNLLAGN